MHDAPLPAGPTARIVGDLLADGYTQEQIAVATGRPAGLIEVLPWMKWVSPATARAVALAGGIRSMRAARVPRDKIAARLGTDALTIRRVSRALPPREGA